MRFPAPGTLKWRDVPDNLAARGINIKWIANDNRPGLWHLGGFMAGAEGAIITGPIKGMVHVPFKGIWHEPAYGAPRYERRVDERREISTRIMLFSDNNEFEWFDNESRFWDGMNEEHPGYWSVFTHRHGELYIPMQLVEASESPLEDGPEPEGFTCQEWDILLAADGEPRWRQPELRPPEWVNDMSATTQVKRDDGLLSPNITVGVGKLKVANRGTRKAWPVFTVSGPGRCWLPNGTNASGGMLRSPNLRSGEVVTVDTNPENRMLISNVDPTKDNLSEWVSNAEMLRRLLPDVAERSQTILERWPNPGRGFTRPVEANSIAVFPIYHSQVGARVSVRLPQIFERAIS